MKTKTLEQLKSILRSNWLFVFLTFLYCLVQYFFLQNNTVPMQWDDAWFYENSIKLFDNISRIGFMQGIFEYVKIGQTKPPLINMLMTVFFFLFGRNMNSIIPYFLFLILFNNILLLALFQRYKNLSLPIKILAFSLLNLSPISVGLSRIFMADYLMGIMIFFILIEFTGQKRSFILGVLLALGLLAKTQFIIYIISIYVYILFSTFKKPKNIFMLIFPSLILFFPWVIYNLKIFIDFTYNISFGGASKNYSLGGIFDLNTFKVYWLQIINYVIGAINLAGIILFIFLARKQKNKVHLNKDLFIVLISLFLFTLILSFNVNKAFRFAYPLIVYTAFLAIYVFKNLRNTLSLTILSIVILVLSSFSLLNTSFPKFSITREFKSILFFSPNLGTNYPFRRGNWKQKEILEEIKIVSRNKKSSIIFLGDYQYFNLNNFSLYSTFNNFPFNIGTIAYFSKNLNNEEVFDLIKNNDFFIYKHGGNSYEDPGFNYRNKEIYDLLKNISSTVDTFSLPDGGVAIVLKKTTYN